MALTNDLTVPHHTKQDENKLTSRQKFLKFFSIFTTSWKELMVTQVHMVFHKINISQRLHY